MGHYFGIDASWIRLAWIVLIFGFGTGLLLYLLLWILVPEAKTTAEKIMMTGEPVNISNIEKKLKTVLKTYQIMLVPLRKPFQILFLMLLKKLILKNREKKLNRHLKVSSIRLEIL